jgi:tripartite-type tricarboxylate transporter receptor subunit TctC
MKWILVVVAALSLAAQAQPFPSKPVRFIVPFPPGGPTDIIGRLAAERLTQAWSAQVVVDNRPGGAGNIGMEQCARSPADGYTMCMISIAQSISPAIYPKLGFDPVADFSHVALLATLPSLLVVHPSVPARNVKELIAYARARPGALNYASGGSGTSSHMLMEMFDLEAGARMVNVAYKGTGPALVDQVSGLIQVAFSTAIAALPYVQSGRLRALAVSTKERLPTLPDVPTIAESGLPGFDGGSWQGLVMPTGAPQDIVRKVNTDVIAMLNAPDMREKILAMGGMTRADTPEQFSAFVRAETEKWAKVARAAHVKIE